MKNIEDISSYIETYFHVVRFIAEKENCEKSNNFVLKTRNLQGVNGLYILGKGWTEEFEKEYADVKWGEDLEYYDTLEEFLIEKNTL